MRRGDGVKEMDGGDRFGPQLSSLYIEHENLVYEPSNYKSIVVVLFFRKSLPAREKWQPRVG